MLARTARLATALTLAAAATTSLAPTPTTPAAAPAAAEGSVRIGATAVADVPVQASAVSRYNDVRRGQQWALTTLRAETLHAKRTANGVVVAVIDSGVQGNHPDLVGRLVPGYDFVTNRPGGTVDGYGHGTHVAGIIAATANNRTGVAGLAPEAKVMPLRVLDDRGAGWGSDVGRALRFAADRGAKVASISLSSRYSQAVADAVVYAQRKGVIVVAATGNDHLTGNPTPYPAVLPGVIGVGATDSALRIGSFSNRGPWVDVTAPGVSIVSTYKRSGYVAMNGTSMATPYVAAAVAVLAAQRPGLTPAAATAALTRSARDLGARGRDDVYGYGQVRPVEALCTLGRC